MGAGFTSSGVALRGGFGLVVETAAVGRGGGGTGIRECLSPPFGGWRSLVVVAIWCLEFW